jgi:hypothetical protein
VIADTPDMPDTPATPDTSSGTVVLPSSTDLVPVGDRSPVRLGSAAMVEQASQTLVGLVLVLGDAVGTVLRQLSPGSLDTMDPVDDRRDPSIVMRRVTLGFALDAQRRSLDLIGSASQVVGPTVRWVLANPLLQPASRMVGGRIDAAYAHGLEQEEAARALAGRAAEHSVALAVPVVLSTVELKPIVDRVLGDLDLPALVEEVMAGLDLPALVERVMADLDLDPIVQRVLADLDLPALVQQVIGDIEMSAVVLDATGGITGEAVTKVRDQTAAADGLIERSVARVLRRRLDPTPPFGLAAEPPGSSDGGAPS